MQLRPRQKKAIESLHENYLNYKRPAIICATGGFGKSIVQAKFAECLGDNVRILQVADRKELLEQNEGKYHPSCNVGVVSTGLERKEYDSQIVIGGIQTVYNKAHLLGRRDVIIIEECDLYDGVGGMYHELIKAYPDAKVFGLSGSPWRTGEGRLTWGDIVFNVTYKEELEDGYLAPVTNKIEFKPNLSEVKKSGGDYTESSLKEKYLDVNNSKDWMGWVEKLAAYGEGRKSWLVFLPTVEHAQKMAFSLAAVGVLARAITGDTNSQDRENWIEEFKQQKLQCLVGVGVFERGFDAPNVDLIADFSPTKSLKKWLQRLWRGVRLSPDTGKQNLLYLDFAGNLKEHGSINNQDWMLENGEIKIKKKYVEKPCPACETFIPVFAKVCPHCQHEFLTEEQKKTAYTDADFERDINKQPTYADKVKWYAVTEMEVFPNYVSQKGYKMMRINYKCGQFLTVSNYIFENQKAGWLKKYGGKQPKKIQVDCNGKYPQLVKGSEVYE